MNQPSKTDAVIIDANILIAICGKEQGKSQTAELAMADYAAKGWFFYAPSVIVSEVLYVLCRKFQDGALTKSDYDDSIVDFTDQLKGISPPPNGEASLAERAEEIRQGYGCSRSSDSLYIALAEELAVWGNAELLTFDKGFVNQVAKNAPTVTINLLPV